jgi:hypothetical protein
MDYFTYNIYILLQLVCPVVGYTWALRSGRPRLQVVLAAALGGALAGFVLAFPSVSRGAGLWGVANVLMAAVVGGAIALAGLVARAIGAWLSRRP